MTQINKPGFLLYALLACVLLVSATIFTNQTFNELQFLSLPVLLFILGIITLCASVFILINNPSKKQSQEKVTKEYQKLFQAFSQPVLLISRDRHQVVALNQLARHWLGLISEKEHNLHFSQLQIGNLKSESLNIQRPPKGLQHLTKQVFPFPINGQDMLLVVLDTQSIQKKQKPAISLPIKGLPIEQTMWVSLHFTGEITGISERFAELIRSPFPTSFLELLRPGEKKKFTEAIQQFILGKPLDYNLITRIQGKKDMLNIVWDLQWSGEEGTPTLTMIGIDLTQMLTRWRNEKKHWEQHEVFWSKVPMNGWSVDFHSFRMLYATVGTQKLFGMSTQEFQSDPNSWLNLVLPEDRTKVYDTLRTLERNNESHYFYRILTPDGQQKTIESHQFIERSEDGKPIRIHGISFEAPLHEQERALQFDYLDAIHLPLMVVGKSGKILYVNKEISQQFQLPKSELIDHQVTQFMPIEQWQKIENELQSQSTKSILKEIRWTGLKGPAETEIHAFQHGMLFRLNKGDARLHRHQPEKAALQMFRRIISYSPDLIWSINLNLEIQVANQPFLEATQMSHDTVHEGWYLHGLVHDHLAMNWWLEKLNQVFEGAIIREEFDLKTMGWKGDVAEFLIFPIHDADQRISGAGCIARNISHFKHLESNLRDRNQALENLIYHTSHHLRAPLANAMGLIHLLKDSEKSGEEEQQAKEKLNETLLKLDQIIRLSIQQTRNILTNKN